MLDLIETTPLMTPADTARFRSVLNGPVTTGCLSHDWNTTKKLICIDFITILTQLLSLGQTIAVEDGESWETRARRVVTIIDRWDSPPFTLQRLAEIILAQHVPDTTPVFKYASASKFLQAVTKSVCGITARPRPGEIASASAAVGTGDITAPHVSGYASAFTAAGDDDEVIFFDSDGNALELLTDAEDEAEAAASAAYLTQSALTVANPDAYGPNPGARTPRSSTPALGAATGGAAMPKDTFELQGFSGAAMVDED
jgi:hypothetical protein